MQCISTTKFLLYSCKNVIMGQVIVNYIKGGKMVLKDNTARIMVGFGMVFLVLTCTGIGAVQSYTNQTLWKFDTNYPVNSTPTYYNGTTYVNSESTSYGTTFAINASTGVLKWQYLTKSIQSSPTYHNDTLYVTGNKVYALNASIGNLKWLYDVRLTSTPTIYDDVLYASGSKIYALDALTGALRWNYNTVSSSTPTAYNGIIYIGSDDGNVYALNSDTGSLIWNYTTGSKVHSSPEIVENILYVGSQDNHTYALNASTGSLIWKYQTGGAVDSSPAVINGSVYIGSDDEYVYSINSTTGELNWQYKTDGAVASSLTVTDDLVFVGSSDAYVYAINATTGDLYWKYRTGSDVISSPVVSNEVVYIGCSDNHLYAIGGNSGVTDLDNPYYFSGSFTILCGQNKELKEGYNLTLVAVDANGNKALMNLTKNGGLLDERIVSSGEQYYYNRSVDETNRIIINFTLYEVFEGQVESLAAIRDIEQYPDIDSVDTDPTKLLKLDNVSNLGNNYSIKLTDIGQCGDKGLLILKKNDSIIDEQIVEEGKLYSYKRRNVSSDSLETILEIPVRKMFSSESGDYIEYLQDYSLYSDVNTVDIEETIIVQQSNSWNLNEGYSLIVDDISLGGDEVLISLNKYGVIVDQQIIEENSTYQYNRFNVTDELSHNILKINVTNILNGKYGKYVEFSTNYSLSSDDDTIGLLGSKIMKSGDRWDIGNGYNLSLHAVDSDGEKAWVELTKNGLYVDDDVIVQSESFKYTSPEWGIVGQDWFKFNGTISGIIQGTLSPYVEFKPYYTINSNVSYKMATADVKVLAENDTWGVNGYNLTAKEVNLSSNKVLLVLNKSGSTVKEMYVNNGGTFQYENTFYLNDVLQYNVDITDMFSGSESNLVQLSNLVVYDTEIIASDSADVDSPFVDIISPTNNTFVNLSTITVTGTSSDLFGIENITVNGILASGTTDWSANIPLVEGTNIITAVATDYGGNINTTSITIVSDTISPEITITSPYDCYLTSEFNVNVIGTANDVSGIEKVEVNTNTAIGTSNWNKTIVLSEGTNTITVVATDNAGNINTTSINVTCDSIPPTAPTNLTHTDDAPSGYDNDNNTNISWSAATDASPSVIYRIYRDGILNASTTSTEYTFTNETEGYHTYNVSAIDFVGNINTTNISVAVIVDYIDPVIHNVSLSDTSTTYGQEIIVSVNVTDAVTNITNVSAGSTQLVHRSGVFWNGTITTGYGTNTVTVTAYDNASNAATNSSLSYTGPDVPTPPSSGGSGGGSGSSGEEYENIEVKDVVREQIVIDTETTYEFKEESNAIDTIIFTALKNSGEISATIEVLKGRSALVKSDPPGHVYQNMNIWVGKSGFATSNNIADVKVGFKVEKSWIEANNIVVSTIRLCRNHDDVWNPLPTKKISEDEKYIYFESNTPGFSPFSITGDKDKMVATQDYAAGSLSSDVPDGAGTQSSSEGADVVDDGEEKQDDDEGISTVWFVVGALVVTLIGGGAYWMYRTKNDEGEK